MRIVNHEDVQHLSAGTQLVEVLPREEYEWAHLPGAVHVPLRDLDDLAPRMLDRDRPVVTYCHDLLCDMSPRAASWLEHHGFTDVADYAGGKMDWLAHGLAYEGSADLVGRHLDPVPTCRPDDPVAAAAGRADGASVVVVTEADGVVVGTLDRHAFEQQRDRRAEEAAGFGPSTVRPSEERTALDERLTAHHMERIVVTDLAGHLLGLYQRAPSHPG